MKYKTLAELKAAYESGELGREHLMTLDNDCTPVYVRTAETPEWDQGEQLFDSYGPACLLEEALTLLGIPWRNA